MCVYVDVNKSNKCYLLHFQVSLTKLERKHRNTINTLDSVNTERRHLKQQVKIMMKHVGELNDQIFDSQTECMKLKRVSKRIYTITQFSIF